MEEEPDWECSQTITKEQYLEEMYKLNKRLIGRLRKLVEKIGPDEKTLTSAQCALLKEIAEGLEHNTRDGVEEMLVAESLGEKIEYVCTQEGVYWKPVYDGKNMQKPFPKEMYC